jgi:hypothetical protein
MTATPDPHAPPAISSDDHDREPAEQRHRAPSEDAVADIEEHQDSERADDRKRGRPPEDAPAY